MEYKVSVRRSCRCLGGNWFCLRRLERGHATDDHRKGHAPYRWTYKESESSVSLKPEAVRDGDADKLDHLLNRFYWPLMNKVTVVGA